MNHKNNRNVMAYIWVLLALVGRLLPLPPNMNPMTSLSLFSGAQMDKKYAFGFALSSMVISDILLAYLRGHSIFGLWSIFTYSGFAAIVFAGSFLHQSQSGSKDGQAKESKNPSVPRLFSFLLASSFGFWIWTNFGIWATGDHGLYTRDMAGLVACFTNAIPFLRNALIGDLICGAILFAGFYGVRKVAANRGWVAQGA